MSEWLKSDLRGIETSDKRTRFRWQEQLKSDLRGIETRIQKENVGLWQS